MTNLTEQWKNGHLKGFRWYYVKFKTGEIDVCWLTEWSNDELGTGGQYFEGIEEENIAEVLAPVPSYEEWQASENYIDYLKQCISVYESKDKQATETSIAYNELLEENTKLKELLKECRDEYADIHRCLMGTEPEELLLIQQIDEAIK